MLPHRAIAIANRAKTNQTFEEHSPRVRFADRILVQTWQTLVRKSSIVLENAFSSFAYRVPSHGVNDDVGTEQRYGLPPLQVFTASSSPATCCRYVERFGFTMPMYVLVRSGMSLVPQATASLFIASFDALQLNISGPQSGKFSIGVLAGRRITEEGGVLTFA